MSTPTPTAKRAGVTYSNCDGDRDGYTSSESNTYSQATPCPTVAYTDCDGHSYRSAQGNTKGSSDSASSAVSNDSQ